MLSCGDARVYPSCAERYFLPSPLLKEACCCCKQERFSDAAAISSLRWKESLITVASLAATCLFFPNVATAISDGLATFAVSIITPFSTVLSPILAWVNNLSSFTQFVISSVLLALGIAYSAAFKEGCKADGLTWLSSLDFLIAAPFLISRCAPPQENKIPDNYSPVIKKNLFASVIVGPIFEEFVFRVVIPYLYETSTRLICASINLFRPKETSLKADKIIEKTKRIFSGYCFGLIHWHNPHPQRLGQTLVTGFWGTRIFEPAKEDYGFSGCVGAHITNNYIASSFLLLS